MKNKFYNICFIIGIVLSIFLLAVNIYANEDFLKASFVQCLPLLFTLVIVFGAAQYKNDFRKHKDHAERIIFKLQELVISEKFYKFDSDQNETREKEINTNNRKIQNYITILQEYAKQLNIDEGVEYISNEFKNYKILVGDHIKDFDYLAKSEKELQKYSENIDTKCEFIILQLYK